MVIYKTGAQNKGFTLIEMIVTLVILSIISVFGWTFFSSNARTYVNMRNQRTVFQEGAYITERVTRELRDATGSSPCGTTFTLAHGTPADPSTTVAYVLSSGQLTRNGILIGDNISNFSVTGTSCCTVALTRGGISFTSIVCPKNIPGASGGYGGNYYDTY